MARLARVARRALRRLPHGMPDMVRQLALFAGAYYLYRIVRGIVDGEAGLAFEHSRQLIHVEQSVGLFFEPAVQHWAQHQSWLIDSANFMYVNSHFVITTTFLGWLYLARNEAFYFVRNMFLVAMGLALVIYVIYPAAPPRLLPEWGFTDTVMNFAGRGAESSANLLYNPYAAVPSMHVAFSLMVGIPAAMLVQRRALRFLWSLYPLAVTIAVVVTANHFWLDALAGVAVATVAAGASGLALARARPEAWGWRTIKAPA